MFTVTDAAGVCLAERLVEKDAEEDVALRFVRQRERRGWTLELDKPRPADITFLNEGRIVLVLDERSSHLLRNKMLDTRETEMGPRLRLRGA